MTQPFFTAPDLKKSVDQTERDQMAFWEKYDTFQRSIDSRHETREFVFLDGPPFATGSPHYGHILAGTTKDAVPRYWTMKGYRVNRKFGWDCHGLPVEYLVEKEKGIGGKPGIEKMGVGPFNELCRSVVMRARDEWEDVVPRMGRFVDFKHDYKTMDPEFMESVWWVFKQLWDKGLIYEGHKVVPYSPKLGSPLSNFEANLNYQDIDDPAVTVRMKLKNDPNTSILIWTTTPWTMTCVAAVTLGGKLHYSKVKHQDEQFIVATNLLEKNFGDDYVVLDTMMGEDLVGQLLEPMFDYFDDGVRTFPIFADDYVTDTDGTGFVPTSALGEDDMRILQDNNWAPIDPPIDENGYYDETIPELAGQYFRSDPEVAGSKENNANDTVIQLFKANGKLFKREQYRHRYPHCWRTDCCLMSRPIKTWFVKVSAIKDRMIELNQQINWTPSHLKTGRFGKILEGAPDWAISRNRYWGTPLPIWRCDNKDCGHIEVMGSRADLENKAKTEVTDLHKHFVDDMTWDCPQCAKEFELSSSAERQSSNSTSSTPQMHRIEEVLDCWFESGSMPYASVHYPFAQLGTVKKADSYEEKKRAFEFLQDFWTDQGIAFSYEEEHLTNDRYQIWYAERDGKILSVSRFAAWEDDPSTYQIGGTATLPKRQKQGIGTNLINTYLRQAKDQGAQVIYVLSGESAVSFWQRFGFAKTECWNQKTKDYIKEVKAESNRVCVPMKVKVSDLVLPTPSLDIDPSNFRTADFISENMDQTRGWFYTLHVLGTALLDKPIFKNVTCGGIVLAEDGQKMSKSKKNYPDPNLIFEKYGADAMRFYLLQSPVATKGENLKFSEREVEEVLKNLILPLKNAYQFLQLYANLDGWSPTKFSLIRHGEADHNVQRLYSCQDNTPHHLTEKGETEAQLAGKELSAFDHIYASPLVRTQETAQILKAEQNFKGEIQTEDRLREVGFGELEGQTYVPVKDRLKNPSAEPLKDIQTRMNEVLNELATKHPGEHLALVSHGGSIRSLQTGYYGITKTEDHLNYPSVSTGQALTFFQVPESKNELDQWILSELQTLIKAYTKAFDQYDTETVCRLLPPFVDKLNNWYLRRNRQRFWRGGLDEDKSSGYATLHYVLFTVSKLLAPICPFFAEWLYQHITSEPQRSVHLDFVPYPLERAVKPALEARTQLVREIVGLAASIRSRAGVKLRQPLGKLQFALSHDVDLDLDIIAAEANVKQVEKLNTVEGLATAVIKVDARQVGKKFGPKVQQLIKAGKAGEFTLNADGTVAICDEVLQAGEYETAFLTEQGSEADSTPNSVVILDTVLTPELEREGQARELVRAIQDLRKTSGFEISDRITVLYETESDELKQAFEVHHDLIAGEVLADAISAGSGEHEISIDDHALKLTLKKA